ncbi:MAG: 50S ribosomal protein L21 [Actinomycetota bacterium]|nr:50S ribosomal protein L21 [Actinomycetota bacterium]
MYAIVKTGGKQYRVSEGQSLLVERLAAADGDTVALTPLLLVDGADVIDGDDLSKVTVSARIVGHERGPKLRIVKFKPKRGYKRRTGHRQELTRIEVTKLGRKAQRKRASTAAAAPAAAQTSEAGSDGA